jgi:hypothetical protein
VLARQRGCGSNRFGFGASMACLGVLASTVVAAQGTTSNPDQAVAAVAGRETSSPEQSAEKHLRERVTAYWKARMTMNLQSCLPFYEKAFRSRYTPDSFARDFRRLNRFAPEFLGVDSIAFDESGARATVRTRLRTKVPGVGDQEIVASVEEVWLLEDGEWWKAAEPLLPQV